MPKYRDTFKLDIHDLDLIERALREQAAAAWPDPASASDPRDIQDLLGRLHAQKIFYSHVRMPSCPNG